MPFYIKQYSSIRLEGPFATEEEANTEAERVAGYYTSGGSVEVYKLVRAYEAKPVQPVPPTVTIKEYT